MLTNLCNYKSRFVRWTMSGLGQVSFVAGHPTFSLFNPHFPMFFLWFHDDLPWFPYGFPIVSMFRVVCVACGATTSCCGPQWCLWWQMRAMSNVPIFLWTCNGWLWIFDQQILRFNWQDTTISTDCFFLFNRILSRHWCFNFSQLFGFLYISDHLELG